MNFDIQFAIRLIPLMLQYLQVTVILSIFTMVIGLTIAFVIALITDAKIKILSPLLKVYVSFFRGTPLLAQLFLLYFGLAQVFPVLIKLSAFNAALIVLSLNSAAFMSEATSLPSANINLYNFSDYEFQN